MIGGASHRQSLQELHRRRGGQYSRGEPRKCPTSPVRHRDPNERQRQHPGANSPNRSVSSFGGDARGRLSSNSCPFTTSHKEVVFEDCEPGATYEAWLEVTNTSNSAVLMRVSAPSEKRFAQSKTRRHGVVAAGLTSLLHIRFEPGQDTVHGEVVNDSIRFDAPAGEWMVVPLRATMVPRTATEDEGHIVGGNVAAYTDGGEFSGSRQFGTSGFAPGQSVDEYFGQMDEMPMGASTTPAGVGVGWVPGEEFWGEDNMMESVLGGDPRHSMRQRGVSGGSRLGVRVKSAQYTGGVRRRPGSVAVPHGLLDPGMATAAAARAMGARRDRYSAGSQFSRSSSHGGSSGWGGGGIDAAEAAAVGLDGIADYHGSVGSLVQRPSTGTLTTVRRQDRMFYLDDQNVNPTLVETERERLERRTSNRHAVSYAVDNRPPIPFEGLTTYENGWLIKGFANAGVEVDGRKKEMANKLLDLFGGDPEDEPDDNEKIARVLRRNRGVNPQHTDDDILDSLKQLGDGDGV